MEKRLEELITIVDERNSDSRELPLLGINLNKEFFPSVANVIGTDLSKYKLLKKGRFACNLMHVGRDKKVPIALYDGEDAIISPAYPMFIVKDTNEILPEYLMLLFRRDAFDREATFYASAGIRGGFEIEDFNNVLLPVPPIEEQRRIVNEYQTVERRIANNEALIQKLEETAQAIYYHTFVEGIDEENLPEGWKKENIFDVATIIYGFPFDSELFNNEAKGMPLIRIRDILLNETDTYTTELVDKKYIIKKGQILIGMDGGFHMTLWSGQPSYQNQRTVRIICDKYNHISELQVFIAIQPIIKALEASIEGTTVAHLSDKHMKDLFILVATQKVQEEVTLKLSSIQNYIINLKQENTSLRNLLTLLTSKLS